MNDETIDKRLDEFATSHGTVLLGMHKELSSLKESTEKRITSAQSEVKKALTEFSRDQRSQASNLRATADEATKVLTRTNLKFEEMNQEIARLYESFKTIVAHERKSFQSLSQKLTEKEQQLHTLLLNTRTEIQEHQVTVQSFNKITRRIALIGLLVLLSVTIWYSVR